MQHRFERARGPETYPYPAAQRLVRCAGFVRILGIRSVRRPSKAMLVCIDKITCVRMHRLIEFYWNEYANELEKELARTQDEQTEKQIAWMRETRMAVVVSEEQGEVEKFDKWDLNIIPHRRLIKEGMELPASMRDKPSFRNKQRMDLDDAFKEPEHPFRIAIVCAMWLTGFDVPGLSTLYLDKPLKAHTLMQAIARANRVNEGKNNGLMWITAASSSTCAKHWRHLLERNRAVKAAKLIPLSQKRIYLPTWPRRLRGARFSR